MSLIPILPGLLYSDVSDHFPIFQFTLNSINRYSVKSTTVTTQLNTSSLIEELKTTDFTPVLNHNDVNTSYNAVMEMSTVICEKHTKSTFKRKKKNNAKKPWITTGILRSMNTRQKLYKRYLLSNQPYGKNRYIRFRNKLNDIIRLSKRSYYAHKLDMNRKKKL